MNVLQTGPTVPVTQLRSNHPMFHVFLFSFPLLCCSVQETGQRSCPSLLFFSLRLRRMERIKKVSRYHAHAGNSSSCFFWRWTKRWSWKTVVTGDHSVPPCHGDRPDTSFTIRSHSHSHFDPASPLRLWCRCVTRLLVYQCVHASYWFTLEFIHPHIFIIFFTCTIRGSGAGERAATRCRASF